MTRFHYLGNPEGDSTRCFHLGQVLFGVFLCLVVFFHVFGKSISAVYFLNYFSMCFRIFYVFGKSLCRVMFSKNTSIIGYFFIFVKIFKK